jgi:hypothetical protein
MALADPLVLPFSGGSKSLNRINQDGYSSEYLLRETLVEYRAKVRHSTTKADKSGQVSDRHNFEVSKKTFAVGDTPEFIERFYIVNERLPSQSGVELADGVADLMIASSNAFLVALNSWQS